MLCSTHRCGKLNEHKKDEYEKRSCVLVTTSNVTDTMQTERKYKYIIILQSVQSTMEHKTSWAEKTAANKQLQIVYNWSENCFEQVFDIFEVRPEPFLWKEEKKMVLTLVCLFIRTKIH